MSIINQRTSKNNMTIEGLIEQFEVFLDARERTEYYITEEFTTLGRRTYSLYNLEGEIEKIGGEIIAVFDDLEHELKKDCSKVLSAFPECCLCKIEHEWNGCCRIMITLKDGTILIERI